MDRCKQVKEFYDDQISRYKEYLSFVHENELNFAELTGCDESVKAMRSIVTEEWPVDKMPHYKKLRDELRFKLEELKKLLRERIKAEYTQTMETLHALAENNDVVYSLQPDVVVMQKTQPDNILALKNNLNASVFYEQEAAKIMKMATATKPQPKPASGGDIPTPAHKEVCQIRLSTRTVHKICSEKDVDTYLQILKQQLMDHISNGEEIIIL